MAEPDLNLLTALDAPLTTGGVAEAAERGQVVSAIGRIAPLFKAISAIVELKKTGLPKGKLVIAAMR